LVTTLGKRLSTTVRDLRASQTVPLSVRIPPLLLVTAIMFTGWGMLSFGALALGQVLPSSGSVTFEGLHDGYLDLFVLDLDRALLHNLTRSYLNDDTAAWSPDQRRLAFVSVRDGARHLYVLTVGESGEPRRLTYGRIALGSTLGWSPDGRYIAYEVEYRSGVDLYLIEVDAPVLPNINPRPLTNAATDSRYPVWSPDGLRLAYTSWSEGNAEIYTIDPQTMETTNLTHHPDWDFNPAWSPDGSRIAFYSDRTGTRELYVMNTDGTNVRQLSDDDRLQNRLYINAPAWSPDGTEIAYTVAYGLNAEIIVLDVATGEQRRLTHNFALDTHPVWLSDGSGLVFMSDRGGQWGLYYTDARGGSTRQLATFAADRGTLSFWH
jgi:TolB protein